MSLIATALERVFIVEDGNTERELLDPNPEWSPAKVRDFYSNDIPILTTATIVGGDIDNDRYVYRLVSTIGTKG